MIPWPAADVKYAPAPEAVRQKPVDDGRVHPPEDPLLFPRVTPGELGIAENALMVDRLLSHTLTRLTAAFSVRTFPVFNVIAG
jgi:hypothetical protein